MTLDPYRVRRDFPILGRIVGGRPIVYLDSATTSQKPSCVIDAESGFYAWANSNVHRDVHRLGAEATEAYESARVAVARFIRAEDVSSVVFTRGTTESINLVAHAWARSRLGPGDEILTTVLEHHSNLVPWQMAARATGASLVFAGVTPSGRLDLAKLDRLIGPRTRLVAVTGMSNVLGSVTDVETIVARAHEVGALVLVDGAQLVPHRKVDMRAMGADFLAFSGHKMLGPTGIGVLAARPDVLEHMDPFMGGGEMIREVTLQGATYARIPHRFEAGTPPIAQAVGLGAAVEYLESLGMDQVEEHGTRLTSLALDALRSVEGVTLHGPDDVHRRGPVISFNLEDGSGGLIHPHDVATFLDSRGVAIRVGHHCAQPLMAHMGVPATCRVSFSVYSTDYDVEVLVRALEETRRFFAGEDRDAARGSVLRDHPGPHP